MDIKGFMRKESIKKEKTVLSWLEKGYIPGAELIDGKWYIPENARKPYTERRACNGYSIYKSMVKAFSKGKNIVPQLYNMTTEKFDLHLQTLKKWGLIEEEKLDGLTYYNATPKGMEFISFNNSQLNKFIQMSISSGSEGAVTALIKHGKSA